MYIVRMYFFKGGGKGSDTNYFKIVVFKGCGLLSDRRTFALCQYILPREFVHSQVHS